MRTRDIKIQFWINENEEEALNEKIYLSGLNQSDVFRRMILDIPIREKPDDRFYDSLKELRAIGNNLNQIAHRLNAIGEFNNKEYFDNVKTLNNFILDIKEKYLL